MENNKIKNFLCSPLGKVGLTVVLYAVFLILTLAIVPNLPDNFALFILIPFAFFGWKFLNKLQPDIFLIMPIVGWIIFYVVKAVLSVICGLFVTPYVISKSIIKAVTASLDK